MSRYFIRTQIVRTGKRPSFAAWCFYQTLAGVAYFTYSVVVGLVAAHVDSSLEVGGAALLVFGLHLVGITACGHIIPRRHVEYFTQQKAYIFGAIATVVFIGGGMTHLGLLVA